MLPLKMLSKVVPRSPEREEGAWITDDMIKAYVRLHEAGYAHAVEAWDGDDLAGGSKPG